MILKDIKKHKNMLIIINENYISFEADLSIKQISQILMAEKELND